MKDKMIELLRKSILALLLVSFMSHLQAQDKSRVYMSMDYKQSMNPGRLVQVELKTRKDRRFLPVSGIPVKILMETEHGDSLLSTVYSNPEGKAFLAINNDYNFVKDDAGFYKLKAEFSGSENYRDANRSIKSKDIRMKAEFFVEDSVKKIEVQAHELGPNGERNIPEEVDLEVYVDRLYDDLKVEETEIAGGKARITFPNDIPGDPQGNINLRLVIDDRPYHLVELNKTIDWGVPLAVQEPSQKTSLTTLSYILFMVVSLIIITVMVILLKKKVVYKS